MPREVGARAGGPTLVHSQIPVVFFTLSGIPGEMTDDLVSSQGPVAVCVQAMQHIGQFTLLRFVLHLHGLPRASQGYDATVCSHKALESCQHCI